MDVAISVWRPIMKRKQIVEVLISRHFVIFTRHMLAQVGIGHRIMERETGLQQVQRRTVIGHGNLWLMRNHIRLVYQKSTEALGFAQPIDQFRPDVGHYRVTFGPKTTCHVFLDITQNGICLR